jgi:hypothetical protein
LTLSFVIARSLTVEQRRALLNVIWGAAGG